MLQVPGPPVCEQVQLRATYSHCPVAGLQVSVVHAFPSLHILLTSEQTPLLSHDEILHGLEAIHLAL